MNWNNVTIRQADSLTHTEFMVSNEGTAFPNSNYEIALRWEKEGLLDPISQALMDAIVARRGKVKGG